MTKRQKAIAINELLEKIYPEATCSLEFRDPFQLMVATQLAAQCTDARVNMVTPGLFKKYPDPWAFAVADVTELENEIRSTGFYKNKARNLIGAAKMLVSDFAGKLPENMEDLLKLPGVGRKTANLVLGDSFGIPGIVVDTHAGRLSRRMGLTVNEDPAKVEQDLMKLLPKDKWSNFGHLLVYHGRAVCTARKPSCGICQILPLCDFGNKP